MRLKPILVGLASLALLFGGGPASAQLAPGVSGFSDAPTTATEDEYWFFMRELGRCLAQTKRPQAATFLQTPISTAQEKRAFDALISRRGTNTCMRNMVSATLIRARVRGSVAEGLYKMQPEAAVDAPVPQGLAAPQSVRSIHDFADCYVAGNYAEARRFLADTKLGTKEEHERVREMASKVGPCLPQGKDITIVPTDIRMALAEALYRASTRGPAMIAQGSN